MAGDHFMADDFAGLRVARTAHFVFVQRHGHFRCLDDGAAWIDGRIKPPSADNLRDHPVDQDLSTVG